MPAPGNTSARDAAVQIVRTLRDAGHVAYLAGGCVRDMLLGLSPQDYDVATDAPPDAVRDLFRNARFVGEAFGVVLVRLYKHEIEVATFRAEWGYEDGRRPSHVEFTDAQHDAMRRDFTVNGLFEDPLLPASNAADRVIDFVGGRKDLEARVLRAIGDPRERFAEDFLRMLRAPRFAARLGFALEESTAGAIRDQAPNLARISRERIGQEVSLMLGAPTRAAAATLIQDLGLDAPTLSEANLCSETPTLAALASEAAVAPALVAWMLDRHLPLPPAPPPPPPGTIPGSAADLLARFVGDTATGLLTHFVKNSAPPILSRWRDALCLSNEDRDRVQQILNLLPRALAWSGLGVAPRKRLLAEAAWPHTLSVLRAWARRAGVGPAVATLESQMPPLLASGVAPRPWVTGDDLIALGHRPGPPFKRLLDEAYDRQLDGTFPDRAAALAWLERQR